MIHAVRKVLRALRRRSVWQVLGAYLVLAALVLVGIDRFSTLLGLPLWTALMALALLAIGLPVVAATAVVQRVGSDSHGANESDPSDMALRTPRDVHVVPEAHPLHGAGPFTWRNAILGGVMAGALLVTSVVAYLAMWGLGFGPIGSLVARGLIAQDDTLVVARFENRTDVERLGRHVTELLRRELARSSLVTVLAAETAEAAGRPRVVLDGEVSPHPRGLRLTTRLVLPDGSIAATYRHVARSEGALATSAEVLSERIRAKLGESFRSIRQPAGDNGR